MSREKELKKTLAEESIVSRNLYLICFVVTLVTMAMTVVEFFSRGQFFSAHLDLFYIGILIVYSIHKEVIRWVGNKKTEHQGEYFVYAWVLLTLALYVVNFLSRDYYSHLAQGGPSTDLRDTAIITLEVLTVFIFTRCAKLIGKKVVLK